MSASFTPVAWRYRYLHPGRVNHWIVRQSPMLASEASAHSVAVEVEPLYPPVAAELYEALILAVAYLSELPHEPAHKIASALAKARGEQ